jgi:two-component system, sensor histidine kinase and response regulator
VSTPSEAPSGRVLILTPTGRDGEMVRQRLQAEGYACEVCPDVDSLLGGLAQASVAVVAQEALTQGSGQALLAALDAQEPWSDVPILLLTFALSKRAPHAHAVVALFERANVMLLQRPLKLPLFLSALQSAVRARRRQQEMRDLHRKLSRAVQMGDLFVSILGHDLRTPLGAIKMSAEVIVRGSQDARALRPAGRILTSADRIARMIEQLLDFARARHHGGVVLEIKPANLDEIARQIVQELEDSNPSTTIQLVESGDMSGTWDADRLARVVSNLAGNAVKHGTEGTRITVEIEGTDQAVVRLRISNAGAIPAESIPTLFEPFKRTAPARTGERGLGLGLFIAREIVRAHDGDITLHTADGDTTVFEVTLPREARPREIAAPAPTSSPP